jgi:ferredoxin-type protein NapG
MENSQKKDLPDEPKDVQGSREASHTKRESSKRSVLMSRRSFVLGASGIVVLGGLGGLRFTRHTPLVRPPGGQDEDRVIAACNRCERCYEICPREVIVPAHIEKGIVTMRTPTFDFSRSYCDWCQESNEGQPLCVRTCPTRALELPAGATPENTILGEAVINEDWCLAYRLIGCRFCYDACPYEAMDIDSLGRPFVIKEKCNGCGACESVCVSLKNASITLGATDRAIVVRPLDATQGGEA